MSRLYRTRLGKLLSRLKKTSLDAVMAGPGPNLRYLTGLAIEALERPVALVATSTGSLFLLVPLLEYERAVSLEELGIEVRGYRDDEDPYKVLGSWLSGNSVRRLGLEGSTPYRVASRLLDMGLDLVVADDLFSELRIRKDEWELKLVREASRIAEEALREAYRNLSPGVSERELARIIRDRAEELGAESAPFIIVQSGPNTALPHAQASNRRVEAGDVILFDIVVSYQGYYADITRTIVLGEPREEHRRIYEAVLEAQEKAIEAVAPGARASDVDKAARSLLEEKGYAEYFIHRTGHGLGLEVHEEPYIAPGNNRVLEPGMLFTIEPGVYLPGRFGVRLEDDIVVTSSGREDLTRLCKDISQIC
ncbi:MAG: Xaa-Pro peptidase family protein [Pyrodictiaceae archaeon]